jgi:hypothetical protein
MNFATAIRRPVQGIRCRRRVEVSDDLDRIPVTWRAISCVVHPAQALTADGDASPTYPTRDGPAIDYAVAPTLVAAGTSISRPVATS